MTRKAYRCAMQRLTKYKLATFKGTHAGTIATVSDSRVYQILADAFLPKWGQLQGQLVSEGESSNGASDGAAKGPSRGQQGATNKKDNKERLDKNEKEGTSPPLSRFPSLVEWLAEAKATHPDWPDSDSGNAWRHYESSGWMRGQTTIKKWKLCIATCYSNFKTRQTKPSTPLWK